MQYRACLLDGTLAVRQANPKGTSVTCFIPKLALEPKTPRCPPKKEASVPKRKRVPIVDDHPMKHGGLSQLIAGDSDLILCGEAKNTAEALAAIARLSPDLVLADISLPDRNGLELIKDALPLQPEMKILAISMHDEAFYAERVLRAGARGYIMKLEGGQRIAAAIK